MMESNYNFIQPFFYSTFLSDLSGPEYSPIMGLQVWECTLTDFEKYNDPLSITFIPSGTCMWIIGYDEYDTPSSIYYVGSLDHIEVVQLKRYHHYFCVCFGDDCFYLTPALPEITSPADMRNVIIHNKVAADFIEYDLIKQLKTKDSFHNHALTFIQFLEQTCSLFPFSKNVLNIHNLIQSNHGCISIHELSALSGYSTRHVNRIYTDTFGYGPKDSCKYIRFQKVLGEILSMPQRNNSEFIQNIGYSDQAHFQREFKMFMGITPKQYISFLCQKKI